MVSVYKVVQGFYPQQHHGFGPALLVLVLGPWKAELHRTESGRAQARGRVSSDQISRSSRVGAAATKTSVAIKEFNLSCHNKDI